jgi:CMP-N,N'-diacetyllegionaminic acid synthase
LIRDRTVLAIVPARGGSKGVPGKNICEVGGRPLLAWTLDAAAASEYVDRTILSSEDAAIIAVARELGCDVPFVRPDELAADETPGIAPVLHALDTVGERFDYVVLLQPTSPLRTARDIDGAIEECVRRSAPACVSVTEAAQSPSWMYSLDEGFRLHALMEGDVPSSRQESPAAYVLNGAVYVAECDWLRGAGTFLSGETVAYVMSRERSLDIDTPFDLRVARAVLGHR